jgi:parallel beta-helix repeat protein
VKVIFHTLLTAMYGICNAVVVMGAVPSPRTLVDDYKLGVDPDDTASFTRAVADGGHISLGPRVYTVNGFSTGKVSAFILKGIKGHSVIKQTTASSAFFVIQASTVRIDGVTFDANSNSVRSKSWAVLLNGGVEVGLGQNIDIQNSVFRNHSGNVGYCLAIISVGPKMRGSLRVANNEFTNCSSAGLYLGSVSNGIVSNNYVHDNPGNGIFAGSYLAPTLTNYLTDVVITNNTIVRNTLTGLAVGGISPPYVYGAPSASHVRMTKNRMQDNGSANYEVSLQGDYLVFAKNKVNQSAPSSPVFGGIDCNSRYEQITDNEIELSGSHYGIDCGGSVGASISGNRVELHQSGTAIAVGGNKDSIVAGNTIIVDGAAEAVSVVAIETDSQLVPFPVVTSNVQFVNNNISLAGTSARGISVLDNAGGFSGALPLIIKDNTFTHHSGAKSGQDVLHYGSDTSVTMTGNTIDGHRASHGAPSDSAFGSITYVWPAFGGSGYTKATTLSVHGAGCTGWEGKPLISEGVIIGVRTSNFGSGCSGQATVVATDPGGGSGAKFLVGQNSLDSSSAK